MQMLISILYSFIDRKQQHSVFKKLGFVFKLYGFLVSRFGLHCIYFSVFQSMQLQHKFSCSGQYRVKDSLICITNKGLRRLRGKTYETFWFYFYYHIHSINPVNQSN